MKLIVRFTIFLLAIYFISLNAFAWCGIDISTPVYRLPLEYILYMNAKDNPKYNCRYARFLALSIVVTDSFTIIDSYFNIVPNVYAYLAILSAVWMISIITTIILGINHFKKVRNIRKRREYEEYRLK